MRTFIFSALGILYSFTQAAWATPTFEVKTLPEESYLFKVVNQQARRAAPQAQAPAADPEQAKIMGQVMKMAQTELENAAKELGIKLAGTALSVTEPAKFVVTEVGLPVAAESVSKVPRDKLKTRPAGKYLVMTFKGNPIQFRDAMFRLREFIKENQLRPKGKVFYEYTQLSDPQTRFLHFPI